MRYPKQTQSLAQALSQKRKNRFSRLWLYFSRSEEKYSLPMYLCNHQFLFQLKPDSLFTEYQMDRFQPRVFRTRPKNNQLISCGMEWNTQRQDFFWIISSQDMDQSIIYPQLLAGSKHKFERFFEKAYRIRAAAAIPGLSRLMNDDDPSLDLTWTQFCRNGWLENPENPYLQNLRLLHRVMCSSPKYAMVKGIIQNLTTMTFRPPLPREYERNLETRRHKRFFPGQLIKLSASLGKILHQFSPLRDFSPYLTNANIFRPLRIYFVWESWLTGRVYPKSVAGLGRDSQGTGLSIDQRATNETMRLMIGFDGQHHFEA